MKERSTYPFLVLFVILLIGCSPAPKKVLVFSKTAGFHHSSIDEGQIAIQKLGLENGFLVDTTADASWIVEEKLSGYDAVIFLSTTMDVLDHYQQADFKRYIQSGGGFVGVHAAADTEYNWPWYGGLVGAYFAGHPHQQVAKVQLVDANHSSTSMLPEVWERKDEWYNYKNIQDDLTVVLNLDETSYEGGTNGSSHPIAWYHQYDGGRAFYTGLGHTEESYEEELFLQHLLGGIQYAMQGGKPEYSKATTLRVPAENRLKREVLTFNLNEPMELEYLPGGDILFIQRGGDLKLFSQQRNMLLDAGSIDVDRVAEDGLLGLAKDPNYANNNWIYLFFTPNDGTKNQRLSRFEFKSGKVDISSEVVMLEFPSSRECCHSGGSLEFDADGNLYLSTGDNTNPFESEGYSPSDERPGRAVWDAQKSSGNTNDLRGKILRITPQIDGSYTIPKGNLFEDDDPKTRPEIYVMGLRNPFRMSLDMKRGTLYWGDVGPDAGNNDSLRGPRGHDELNQARQAGNWGWPYTRGDNKPYADWDFVKDVPKGTYDPNNLINDSPNNTGIANLPPAQSSFIWYPYDNSPEFPWLGAGGRNAMAGPVYYLEDFKDSENPFPAYFDGKLFFYDWIRDWIFLITMDENQDFVEAEPFMGNSEFHNIIDMQFGPDGSLYLLEYGESWNTKNLDAQLNKITFVSGNRAPIARIEADKRVGATPLSVAFTADRSEDLEGDELTFSWDFGNGQTSDELSPNAIFDQAGSYEVKLVVSDADGLTSEATYQVVAGNDPPRISIELNGDNPFYTSSKPINYTVSVEDTEDGTLGNGIDAESVEVTLTFLPEGKDRIVAKPGHKPEIKFPGETFIGLSDCKACHAPDKKVNGPSYREIANKYDEGDLEYLKEKIQNGGSGVWGETPMSAHPQLADNELTEIVKYVLSFEDADKKLTAAGTLVFDQHKSDNFDGVYLLTASYTDRGADGVESLSTQEQIMIKSSKLEVEHADDRDPELSVWSPAGRTCYGNVKNGRWFVFNDINFDGLGMIRLGVHNNNKYQYRGTVEIRKGSKDGPLLGSKDISYFHPTKSSAAVHKFDLKEAQGKDKLYFVFKNEREPDSFITNPDWFVLDYE